MEICFKNLLINNSRTEIIVRTNPKQVMGPPLKLKFNFLQDKQAIGIVWQKSPGRFFFVGNATCGPQILN